MFDGVRISIKVVKCEIVRFFGKQNSNMAYSFQAKVVAREYHVYRNITWEEAKCGDEVLIDLKMDKK